MKLRLCDENVTATICSVLISSGCGQGQSPREADPKRKLLEEDDFSLMLFGLLKEVFLQLASETTHSWERPPPGLRGGPIKHDRWFPHPCLASNALGLVADRYYGLEYDFFHELSEMGASYVIRIRNQPLMEVVAELPLSEADRAAGVTWQGLVKPGKEWQGDPIRVVKIGVEGKELLIVTDLELEAELISLIYRYRWQVELFFKWLKCILKCHHSMAESLKKREDVRAFLEAGTANRQQSDPNLEPKEFHKTPERRIAVTLRLPEKIAHALIDASAERRKNRKRTWSQQDIVAEALEEWFTEPKG